MRGQRCFIAASMHLYLYLSVYDAVSEGICVTLSAKPKMGRIKALTLTSENRIPGTSLILT